MQGFKQERIVQILSNEINTMIVMGKIKDPRVSSRVSVLYVSASKDLTSAVVYVSSFLQDATLYKTVSALNHAKGYIQKEIAKKHKWRNTPKLLFKASDGLKHGERVRKALDTKHIDISDDSLQSFKSQITSQEDTMNVQKDITNVQKDSMSAEKQDYL